MSLDSIKEGLGVAGDAVGVVSGIAGLFGGKKDRSAQAFNAEQLKFQEDLAKQGIRWRVRDAKEAGIHPLYALGAPPMSFNPILADGGSAAKEWSDRGQDLSRSLQAASTSGERVSSVAAKLAIRRAELENDLLSAQIAKERAALGPPLPMPGAKSFMPGQGDPERLGLTVAPAPAHVQQKPMEVTVPNPRMTNQEPAAVSDLGFSWTGSGYAPIPSKDVKERMEDVTIPQLMWGWRNNVLPNIPGQGKPPPAHLIPEGYNNWRWSYSKQEWQPHYDPHRARIPVQRGGR